MKKLILITALLISGSVFSQNKQEFGNWHYEYGEYQMQKSKESDWKTEGKLGKTTIQFVKYKKSFYPVAEISVVGELTKKYYVINGKKLKEGEHYCKLKSFDGVSYSELIVVEGEYAILLFSDGISRAVFYVK